MMQICQAGVPSLDAKAFEISVPVLVHSHSNSESKALRQFPFSVSFLSLIGRNASTLSMHSNILTLRTLLCPLSLATFPTSKILTNWIGESSVVKKRRYRLLLLVGLWGWGQQVIGPTVPDPSIAMVFQGLEIAQEATKMVHHNINQDETVMIIEYRILHQTIEAHHLALLLLIVLRGLETQMDSLQDPHRQARDGVNLQSLQEGGHHRREALHLWARGLK